MLPLPTEEDVEHMKNFISISSSIQVNSNNSSQSMFVFLNFVWDDIFACQ